METLESPQTILQAGKTTTEKALQLFDSLEPVNLDFMLGRWQGSGLHTAHPMDGLLEASNWYGKEFINPATVHPLLFLDPQGEIIKVAPQPLVMKWALNMPGIKSDFMKPFLGLTSTLLKTEESQARLRMISNSKFQLKNRCLCPLAGSRVVQSVPLSDRVSSFEFVLPLAR